MAEEKIHKIISCIEAASNVACFLQDTRSMVGHASCKSDSSFAYTLVWDWVKEKLDQAESLLYEFLADYKDLIDQMKPPS